MSGAFDLNEFSNGYIFARKSIARVFLVETLKNCIFIISIE
jgi:hypothetical protein